MRPASWPSPPVVVDVADERRAGAAQWAGGSSRAATAPWGTASRPACASTIPPPKARCALPPSPSPPLPRPTRASYTPQAYRARYWNEHYFGALAKIEAAAAAHGLTPAEVALRWLSHHSALKRAHGDAVLIGASSVEHVEQNLADLEKGPLRESSPLVFRRVRVAGWPTD